MPVAGRSQRQANGSNIKSTGESLFGCGSRRCVGVSKMTLLRYIDDGRLPQPKLFLLRQGLRVWLWNAGELERALQLWRTSKRGMRTL
jgi:hypothetical protein